MAFIVDNSVVIGWLLPAQATAYTRRVLTRVRREQIIVPSLWPVELANVMIVRRRRGVMTAVQIHAALQRIQRLGVVVDGEPVAPESLFAVGERHGLSAYDAAYLELAQRRGLPLATGDDGLERAARVFLAGSSELPNRFVIAAQDAGEDVGQLSGKILRAL